MLLDRALDGVAEADDGAQIQKIVLNELKFIPCQNCGFCSRTGACRFAGSDDMKGIYEALDASDRFVIASPIYFASVSAQLKAMIDRCQAIWARKYLLKQKHPNPDRKLLFLSCGGFRHERFYRCARQVIRAWCAVTDIKLTGEFFYHSIDGRGDIEKHPTALNDAYNAGKALMG
jgi:multimeric flavodoxin WrbA